MSTVWKDTSICVLLLYLIIFTVGFWPLFFNKIWYFFKLFDGTLIFAFLWIPLNAFFPTVFKFFDLIFITFKFEHPLNAFSFMKLISIFKIRFFIKFYPYRASIKSDRKNLYKENYSLIWSISVKLIPEAVRINFNSVYRFSFFYMWWFLYRNQSYNLVIWKIPQYFFESFLFLSYDRLLFIVILFLYGTFIIPRCWSGVKIFQEFRCFSASFQKTWQIPAIQVKSRV